MNTGDIHNDKTPKTTGEQFARAELADELKQITRQDSEADTNKIPDTDKELVELNQEITALFEKLRFDLDKYRWQQEQIEEEIRLMLSRVYTGHEHDSQIERMAVQLTEDIAQETISGDRYGEIARTGYNKQFYRELELLEDTYMHTKSGITDLLAMAKDEDEVENKIRIVDSGVNSKLLVTQSQVAETRSYLLQILEKQQETIKSALEGFKALQYFKEEEAWNNPAVHLLIETAEKVMKVIEQQKIKFIEQSKLEEDELNELIEHTTNVVGQIANAN